MHPFDRIVEAKLQQAVEDGEFDDLPNAGKPLPAEDLTGVPEELRMAYRVLRNANVLPEELELRQANLRLRDLLEACDDEDEREELRRELAAGQLRYELLMERRGRGTAHLLYADRIASRLG